MGTSWPEVLSGDSRAGPDAPFLVVLDRAGMVLHGVVLLRHALGEEPVHDRMALHHLVLVLGDGLDEAVDDVVGYVPAGGGHEVDAQHVDRLAHAGGGGGGGR